MRYFEVFKIYARWYSCRCSYDKATHNQREIFDNIPMPNDLLIVIAASSWTVNIVNVYIC